MPSAARRLPCGMPERTRRSRGGGNLPPPRMSELARMHLHLPAPCSRLCTPPVPVEVPVDVPHTAFPDRFRVGDMAVNRANACPPTREHCSEAERGNRRVFVRGHRPTAEPAGSARRPPPGGLRASTHPCVDGDKRAHALRTPSDRTPTGVRGISAGQGAHTISLPAAFIFDSHDERREPEEPHPASMRFCSYNGMAWSRSPAPR
jgi:hypothetical protein